MADLTHTFEDEPSTLQAETEAERAARLARERVLLDEGFEDIRAGRFLTGAELEAWLDRFEQGLPPLAASDKDAG